MAISICNPVVLCADDFGLTEGVSRGILELAEDRAHLGHRRDDQYAGLATLGARPAAAEAAASASGYTST